MSFNQITEGMPPALAVGRPHLEKVGECSASQLKDFALRLLIVRALTFNNKQAHSALRDKMAKCSECGSFKMEHYSDDEVEYLVCPDCDSSFSAKTGEKLSDGNDVLITTISTSDSPKKPLPSIWYALMWIAGTLLIIMIFGSIMVMWVGIDLDNFSDFEDIIVKGKLCGTVSGLLWIIYIYSSLMIHKERKQEAEQK